jgi:hypothetical protein
MSEVSLKILFFLIALNFSINAHSMTDSSSSKRLSTPSRSGGQQSSGNADYDRIVTGLYSLKGTGSVSCNQSYSTSARALICNCANEAGNQSLAGMTAVSRVVFSRAKSPDYPNSVRGVVCQRHQFSWTIGGWNSSCTRTRGNPTYFNTRNVTGNMLAKCVKSAQDAAKIELVDKPTQLFALNYCSTNRSAYRNAIPSWCRSLLNTQANRVDDHVFGFANSGQRRAVPARGSAPTSISMFESFKNFRFFMNEAYAANIDEPKIINTRADKKTYYNDKIKEILAKKHKKFSPYTFEDYSESVQNLMEGTRKNLPASITGDYNGDGKTDLVLMGSKKNKHTVIAFLSNGSGYKDYVVSSEKAYKKPLDNYLVNIQKSKIVFDDVKSRDAFQVESFGGAAIAKFFNGNKFVENGKTGFKFK